MALFYKTAVNGCVKSFRLVAGGDEQTVPFSADDFVYHDVGGVDQRTLLALGATTAHALPPERAGDSDGYIDTVVAMLPAVAASGLADAVDAFCEKIGFTPVQTARVFSAAAAEGLPVKLHADQLSDLGGAALAARFGALSADHLEYTTDQGVTAMAEAGTVAVLLPGAFYFLRETKLPPVEALRAAGVPIAIATDSNPGSSPVTSLLLMLNMACTLFRLTPEEALAGVTRHAARALGLAETHGVERFVGALEGGLPGQARELGHQAHEVNGAHALDEAVALGHVADE